MKHLIIRMARLSTLMVTLACPVLGQVYNGHYYTLTSAPSDYLTARQEATAMGGYLVAINDAAEQQWVASTFMIGNDRWIGLTDEAQEGVFVWDSGEPLIYTNWGSGPGFTEPNNNPACGPAGEDYVYLRVVYSGGWNDIANVPCTAGSGLMRGVVEVPLTGPHLSISQPGGAGGAVSVTNSGLVPGNEYFNVFSLEWCPAGPGSGPFLGLCATTPANFQWLLAQIQFPLGVGPFHFLAAGQTAAWGPFVVPPVTLEGVCFEFTGGTLGPVSSVARLSVL